MWCGLLDGPPPDHLQTELLHPAQEEAPGAEGGQETQHNQTEMPTDSPGTPTEPGQQTRGPPARSRQRRGEVGVLQGCSSPDALEVLGPDTRHHQDWFDENDSEIHVLLEEKHRLLRAHQNNPSSTAKKAAFTNMRSKVQSKLRSMQDSWLSAKADEIQGYADRQDTKRFYDALKAVYGPQPSGSSPLLSADGSTLLTDKKQILERWADHFNSVLNRPAAINDEAIARLPQLAINQELDAPPPNEEVSKAIKQMTSGKAPGPDAIPAEVYKMGGETIRSELTNLFQTMWNQEHLPQELKDATIVHIYKRKGNRQSCDNHRGMSLLSIAGKILVRILLNRLLDTLEQGHLPESQCGFRAGRGTSDMIFAAR